MVGGRRDEEVLQAAGERYLSLYAVDAPMDGLDDEERLSPGDDMAEEREDEGRLEVYFWVTTTLEAYLLYEGIAWLWVWVWVWAGSWWLRWRWGCDGRWCLEL